MTTELDKKLWKFIFPVQETGVLFRNSEGDAVLTPQYKSIVREDTNELISIMQSSYKLVTNAEVIKPLLDELSGLDTRWYIDSSHSFVQNNRMKLQVTFPDLTLHDGRSEIALSLYVHNSYDGSEGVRLLWGAIRGICSNGMIYGEVLARFYRKHTSGIRVDSLADAVRETYDSIPEIKKRIELLKQTEIKQASVDQIVEPFGKKIAKYVDEQEKRPENLWALYNILTYYISHKLPQPLRSGYQLKVSKAFSL